MKKFYLFLVCMAITFISAAQISPFLQKGQSGLGVGAGYETGTYFDGVSAKIGTSINGVFDIDVNYYHDQIEQNMDDITLLSDDVSATYFDVIFTWWMMRSKPANFLDVNVGLAPGFEYSSYNNYAMKNDINQTMEYEGYYGGQLGLYSNLVFHVDKNWMVIPFYNMEYQVGHDKETVSSNEKKTNYHGFTSMLGVMVGKQFKQGNSLYLSVKQSSDSFGSDEYFNLEVGYVLPW